MKAPFAQYGASDKQAPNWDRVHLDAMCGPGRAEFEISGAVAPRLMHAAGKDRVLNVFAFQQIANVEPGMVM